MILKTLKLKNFRNYEKLELNLDPHINIIYGPNGSGKTNILESIYVLAFTKSHRSFIESNLIKTNKNQAKIEGLLKKEIPYNLKIIINQTKKQVSIDNNQITKLGTYIEKMNIIIFYSDDLNLIKGYPKTRREYLDLELSQISPTYYKELKDYKKLLKLRNEYLKKLNTKEANDLNYFNILTDYLVEKSVYIYQMRNKYIENLNKICPKIFKDIAGKQKFNIKYQTSIDIENQTKDQIRETLKQTYKDNIQEEIKKETTLYGPHKDDFTFNIKEDNLKYYGSQGQQRLAVLALKLSEIQILKDYKNENPIILLDDVFSELDIEKRNNLLSYISNDMQVIITTTDLENIDQKLKDQSKLIKIENGKIQKEV